MKKIAIFLSGRSSNFKAILDKINRGTINGEINIVISDNPKAKGLSIASENNIEYIIFKKNKEQTKFNYFYKIKLFLHKRNIDLIVLAGFRKILSVNFVHHYENKILNIHPSLLPAFPGENAQQQAIDYGVKISGCTVHFVDEYIDTGPIVFQMPVPILKDDTVKELSDRILKTEHIFYPHAIRLFCDEKLLIKGRKVVIL